MSKFKAGFWIKATSVGFEDFEECCDKSLVSDMKVVGVTFCLTGI